MVLLKEVQGKLPLTARGDDCVSLGKRKRSSLVPDEYQSGGRAPDGGIRPVAGSTLQPQKNIANAHLECFFLTTHDTLPVLDVDAFQTAYDSFWDDSTASKAWQCLLYSGLALGALRSKQNDTLEWSAYYYDKAQDLLTDALVMSCIETVQAAMFMVRHTHPYFQLSFTYFIA